MFSSVFNQVAPVLSLYLPVRTIQDIINSGIVKNCDELLTSTFRYQLYIDIDQMKERLQQFKQSTPYLQSLPEDTTTYQIWDISLYDSFNDEQQKHIESHNILNTVSIPKILSFCLLPQAEYFTTVQSKYDGMLQKINIWTKPAQINEYMDEIIDVYTPKSNNDDESKDDEKKTISENEFVEFKHAATQTWKTICHGVWSDYTMDGIFKKMKENKSTFEKAKYYDWKPTYSPSFDIEFGNFYADDNDDLAGNYAEKLKDLLVVTDFVENEECDIVQKWYAIDIETKAISHRLLIMNNNLLCGLLKMDKKLILKKRNEDVIEEMEGMTEAADRNNKRQNARVKYDGSDYKGHIVIYKFKFIVWKSRYKLKDEINSELAEIEYLGRMDGGKVDEDDITD